MSEELALKVLHVVVGMLANALSFEKRFARTEMIKDEAAALHISVRAMMMKPEVATVQV